jgi:hypothetical protein
MTGFKLSDDETKEIVKISTDYIFWCYSFKLTQCFLRLSVQEEFAQAFSLVFNFSSNQNLRPFLSMVTDPV